MDELPYRSCVVGVFIDTAGLVLVGERADSPGAFQFPQGGIDLGETPQQAILREMREELGVDSFSILRVAPEWLSYDFPEIFLKIARKYRGQTQLWHLLKLLPGQQPDLAKASDKEFCSFKWMEPEAVVKGIIPWKAEVYTTALRLLLDL